MNELRIEATRSSPEILLNPGGKIRIKGRSIHENTLDFYKPVEVWIDTYVLEPAEVTCIDMNLEYFNSASAKIMIQIFQKISRVRLLNKKFIVNWYYEEGDEDIYERGEYFSSVLHMPFNFIKTA
ncbi:MAG TPA: nuclear pore complex subunit [Bacteroidales bacterium]|nr:nuclear pore complex subunit [Bacteroidales bacterium]